eukprot:CAMPEP_0172058646 /NCGR_PEP_ID=MMETSP1043-20130122/6970_1 /TAXON_ID=464988 /ORGANISM="Hemiselmis andersenii, Strain CCMP441" /LENGTH=132 /DNA_ID=CAMNT_0012718215 /DNA_START=211 /DNA_END=605 /DNA_ORIENTATION=-
MAALMALCSTLCATTSICFALPFGAVSAAISSSFAAFVAPWIADRSDSCRPGPSNCSARMAAFTATLTASSSARSLLGLFISCCIAVSDAWYTASFSISLLYLIIPSLLPLWSPIAVSVLSRDWSRAGLTPP